MGIVYLAEHVHLRHRRVVKVLSDVVATDASMRERFLRETRLPARLEHPNVLPVYDAGDIDGSLFVVVPYVHGRDLRRYLDGGIPPVTETLAIVRQVGDALDEAHAAGLVHRDVKPENVMIEEGSGRVYLADFGLVRQLHAGQQLTPVGFVFGTAAYLAPEVLRGEEADGRADQYALACVLFECLTGTVPFAGTTTDAVLQGHLYDDIPKASARNPTLATAVDAPLDRGLAKDPGMRHQDCLTLVTRVELALGVGPSPAAERWRSGSVAPTSGIAAHEAAASTVTGTGLATEAAPTTDLRVPPRLRRALILVPMAVVIAIAAIFISRSGPGDAPRARRGPVVGTEVDTVVTPIAPIIGQTVAVAEGELWVGGIGGGVVSVDPATGVLSTPVEGVDATNLVIDLAYAGGFLWAVVPQGVAKIDTTERRVLTILPVDSADRVVGGAGSLWVVSETNNALIRIDPMSEEQTQFTMNRPADAAFGAGALWVATGTGIERVDPLTETVTHTVDTSDPNFNFGAPPRFVAVGGGMVWTTTGIYTTLLGIDTRSLEVVLTVPVQGGFHKELVVHDGVVWLVSEDTLTTVDPEDGRAVSVSELSREPADATAGLGGLWIVDHDAVTRHRAVRATETDGSTGD